MDEKIKPEHDGVKVTRKRTPEELAEMDERHRRSYLEHPEDENFTPARRAWGDDWESEH